MIRADVSDFTELAADLTSTSARIAPVMTDVFGQSVDDFVDDWRERAVVSSGEHGVHYPLSIDSQRVVSTDIVFEAGPNPNKKQGRMAFETGSANQPPHPDGAAAADVAGPRLERRIDAASAVLGL